MTDSTFSNANSAFTCPNNNYQAEQNCKMVDAIYQICTNGINRHRRSGNPILRTTLFVDKLAMIVDVGSATLENVNSDLSDDAKCKIKAIYNIINEELNFLFDWIHSHEHPDHSNPMKEPKQLATPDSLLS